MRLFNRMLDLRQTGGNVRHALEQRLYAGLSHPCLEHEYGRRWFMNSAKTVVCLSVWTGASKVQQGVQSVFKSLLCPAIGFVVVVCS